MEVFCFLQNLYTESSDFLVLVRTYHYIECKEEAVVGHALQYKQWRNVLGRKFVVSNEGYHRCVKQKKHLDLATEFTMIVPLF